ncbi:hypothetical protein TcasGA2_TC007978 [Tribolium castaneum]|uniref:Uncharacterized protein n=1 Tax=Tribolium castaneum TaxID=7070 RepID=D2A3G1_TRICA|nr:hypothetical protein TcasGA2_TC007978 [Tribolium castaneum]
MGIVRPCRSSWGSPGDLRIKLEAVTLTWNIDDAGRCGGLLRGSCREAAATHRSVQYSISQTVAASDQCVTGDMGTLFFHFSI